MSFKDRNRNLEMREGSVLPPEVIAVRKGLDTNKYATKKTVAQGLLDVALLTANASQLKYILSTGKQHDFYNAMVALIATSIVLQVFIGLLFIVIGGLNIDNPKHHRAANICNDIHEFKVAMSCEGCSGAVERVLGKLKGQGVNNVDIDLPGQKVYVDSTLPEDFLLGTIKKTGKETVYIGLKQ
ncbi:ninjurin-2-like isoform X4 [Artemia franciscana]